MVRPLKKMRTQRPVAQEVQASLRKIPPGTSGSWASSFFSSQPSSSSPSPSSSLRDLWRSSSSWLSPLSASRGSRGPSSRELARCGWARASGLCDRLQVFQRAASLGGVESLCSLPVLTSHWGHSEERLRQAGVTAGMVRLSVGLEDVEDLLADLDQALEG